MNIVLQSLAQIFAVLGIVLVQFAFSWERTNEYDKATRDLLVGSFSLLVFVVIEAVLIATNL